MPSGGAPNLLTVHADFLIASATVIPVLALTSFASGSLRLDPVTPSADAERRMILAVAMPAVALGLWLVTGWAEFICLRGLQTRSLPTGGTTVVWAALVAQAAPIVVLHVWRTSGEVLFNTGYRMLHHGLHGSYPDREP